jgi:DHA3 family macrolide efflux protein-like MFS transporter
MSQSQRRKLWVFYIIIVTQTISIIGSRISGLAIGFHIFNQTGEATPLALVSFFAIIPMVLASSISGVLADRWDRRYVMMVSDAGQALGTVFLLISFGSGGFELWHLYLVTFMQGIFGVFQGPAFQASVTMLVPDEQRDRANAIMQLTGPMAGIISPAIAGVVYAAASVTGAIWLDLFSFIIAMVVVFLVRIPRPPQSAEGKAAQGSLWKEVTGGFRYLYQRRTLFFLMLFISMVNFLFSTVMTLETPYLLSRTEGSTEIMGALLSIMNIGALTGGIIIGVWGGTRPRMHTMMPGLVVSALALIAMGMSQTTLALGITMFLLMLPMPMINALFMSMMQTKVAPDMQGRVFAVIGQVSMLLIPLASLAAGPLADRIAEPAVGGAGWELVAPLVGSTPGSGIGLLMVIFGGILAVSSLVVYALPAIRHMEANLPDYVVEPAPGKVATQEQPVLTPDVVNA